MTYDDMRLLAFNASTNPEEAYAVLRALEYAFKAGVSECFDDAPASVTLYAHRRWKDFKQRGKAVR